VIVIETGENGGTMHAVRFAREQGRSLYAVDNEAAGNRRLITEGADPLRPDPDTWESLIDDLERAGQLPL
jgi:DNA processing protein